MKEEFTVEQKAKRYDEISKEVKNFFDGKQKMYNNIEQALNYLFPELKESEHEMIRIMLIKFFSKGAENNSSTNGISDKDIVAWLEMQGQVKESSISQHENKTCKENSNSLTGKDEQKSADNIEPKFKVGEWIVWENKCYKVNYNCCGYELIDQNGLRTSLEYGTVDTSSRLWDITIDAKDGDVLVNGSNIFIFHFFNDTRLMGYCHVNIDNGRFYDDLGKNECFCLIDAIVTPATKEQHDTLMKAMADAGYTFDFDKKELKKIENKRPLLSDFFKAEYERGKADAQKSAEWSEEDKKKLNRIYMLLAEAADEHAFSTTCRLIGDKECVELQDFLRSLKPQPKQEWSEDDEQMVEDIIEAIDTQYASSDYNEMVNWLLYLKDRYTWKPSDEQIEALDDFIYAKYPNIEKHGKAVKSLYLELKKL